MEFLIRDSRPEDFETLWALDQQCFPPGIAYSRRELSAYMEIRGSFTLVAESREAKVLGFLVAAPKRNGAGHIITIDVSTPARRSGVGSKLLTTAEDRLRELKCTRISLETAVDNLSALAFYKRHQYFLIKTAPRYYSNGVDALVLQKDLLSAVQAS